MDHPVLSESHLCSFFFSRKPEESTESRERVAIALPPAVARSARTSHNRFLQQQIHKKSFLKQNRCSIATTHTFLLFLIPPTTHCLLFITYKYFLNSWQ